MSNEKPLSEAIFSVDSATEKILSWAFAKPLLTRRLAEISRDQHKDELLCTIADLLWPKRGRLQSKFLAAVDADLGHANAVWMELSEGEIDGWGWVNEVDWARVRQELLKQHPGSNIKQQ